MEKKRCTNFSLDEIKVLVDIVEKHKEVVECKKTDTITNAQKEAEWKKIEVEYNVLCATGRSAKMLRSKWDSLKKTTKKEYAQYKQSLYKTGGGPPSDIKIGVVSSKVLGVLGVGATGMVSHFDSDFADETVPGAEASCIEEMPAIVPSVEMAECSTVVENVEIEIVNCNNWESWNPHSLRMPKTALLRTPIEHFETVVAEPTNGETPKPAKFETPKVVKPSQFETPNTAKSIKRKRFYKEESVATKLKQKRDQALYYELLMKKIAFMDFQMNIVKEESERKEKRLAKNFGKSINKEN